MEVFVARFSKYHARLATLGRPESPVTMCVTFLIKVDLPDWTTWVMDQRSLARTTLWANFEDVASDAIVEYRFRKTSRVRKPAPVEGNKKGRKTSRAPPRNPPPVIIPTDRCWYHSYLAHTNAQCFYQHPELRPTPGGKEQKPKE